MNKFVNPTEVQLQDETVIAINKVSKATTGGRKLGMVDLDVYRRMLLYVRDFFSRFWGGALAP